LNLLWKYGKLLNILLNIFFNGAKANHKPSAIPAKVNIRNAQGYIDSSW
jgi:hypothetical protein